MRKAEITVSLSLIVGAIYFLFQTSKIRSAHGAVLGPRFFPYLVLWSIIILSLVVLIQTLRKNADQEDEPFLRKEELIRVLITLVLLLIYVFTLERLGFIVSTAIFITALAGFYYGRLDMTLGKIGVIAVVSACFFHLLFNDFFNILLP